MVEKETEKRKKKERKKRKGNGIKKRDDCQGEAEKKGSGGSPGESEKYAALSRIRLVTAQCLSPANMWTT